MRLALVSLVLCLFGAVGLRAQSLDEIFGELIRQNAEGVLALYGVSALPDDSASTLVLDTGQTDREYDFRASQLGGGFAVAQDFPLYLEGYVAYNRYDPVLFLSDSGTTSEIPLKWTTVSATGGIGWKFSMGEYWSFRPLVHFSLGRVQSDASIGATLIADRLGLDTSFIDGGGITVGGLGGSAALAFNRRWPSDHEFDAQLRYSYLELRPIGGDKDILAQSVAETTAFWTRYRWPTGAQLWNRPVRLVVDGSASYLSGDQGQALGTDWLARLGVGGEVDFSETWVPWVTTTRLMVRGSVGEDLRGFSVGLGVSF
ncbi:MAG: autotransporter outer membrane beta-barrel domain-containing protein [Rhodobacteraceae bacterium]|nr:autotransporter outer membrane beta-barrel domain-containing protein [Paracoccaceae bacterium]